MREFTFPPAILDQIRHERYHHPHPRVQQKMEVLWLKSQGLTHAVIANLADVAPRTVQRYLDEFEEGGLERICRISWAGKPNELKAHHSANPAGVRGHTMYHRAQGGPVVRPQRQRRLLVGERAEHIHPQCLV